MAIEENPGILLYTRIRKSPYFHASRQHGVRRYSVYNHTYHPRHYGDPVGGVLGAFGGRDAVGRGRGAPDRDLRSRRVRLYQHDDPARSEQVRGAPGEVRVHHAAGRGDCQRPGADAAGGEPLLAVARRLRYRVVGPRARLPLRPGCHDRRGGRGAGPAPGAEVQGSHGRPVRREDPRDPLLPHVRGPRAGGHAGVRVPDRLHQRVRLRDLPA